MAGKTADYVQFNEDRLWVGWVMTDAPDGTFIYTNTPGSSVITIAVYPDETDMSRMTAIVSADLREYGYYVKLSTYYEPYKRRPHLLFGKGDRLEGQVVIMPVPGLAKGLLVIKARSLDEDGVLPTMMLSDILIRDIKAKF